MYLLMCSYQLNIILVCDITGLNIFTESDISSNIGFNKACVTGVACRQGTLTPPDTWPRPIWDLHMFYSLRLIFFPNCALRTSLGTFSIYAYSKGLRVCKELHDKLSSICIYKETCGYINTHMYIIDLQIQA